jgi:hypothetical protein
MQLHNDPKGLENTLITKKQRMLRVRLFKYPVIQEMKEAPTEATS